MGFLYPVGDKMKGDNLLIQEPPLQVLPSLAKTIGLNSAIFLQQLHYWATNKKTDGLEKNGYKWIYNTYEEWKENFPFWSERTIQRIILDLENEGIILSEQFGKSHYERKKYYRIDYDRLSSLFKTGCHNQDGQDVTIEGANVARSLNESETTTENTSETNSFENKNESTLPSKESLNHLEKHTLPAGSDLGWMIAAGVKSDEIARQNIDIQNIKEKTDEYERVMGYNPLSWGKKEMINLQKFLAKKSIQDIRRFADWSRKEFSQLSPSKALQFPSLVIELWPQACPVIPERIIEPPKPEPKYAVLDSKEWYKNHPKKEAK
jgi:hypothetical protein